MSDIDDTVAAVLNDQRQARQAVVGAADDSPDDAARAQQLSLETGVPASVIHGDLEGFERQHKAALNSEIISRNSVLQEYINSEPMAAKVSGDDFHNLDEATDAVGKLHFGPFINQPSPEAMKELHEEFDSFLEGSGKWRLPWQMPDWFSADDKEFAAKHPFLGQMVAEGSYGMEVLLKGLGGFSHLIPTTFKNKLVEAGMDERQANMYADSLGGFLEWKLTDMAAHGISPHVETPARPIDTDIYRQVGRAERAVDQVQAEQQAKDKFSGEMEKVAEAVHAARPWIESGRSIPYGIHEVWDDAIKETSREDLKALDDAQRSVARTKTKERSPELMTELLRRAKEGNIEIDAEAVRGLYGDDLPTPDDGKLGWIPTLREQLEAVEPIGGKISVPAPEYLARVEPEVYKQLREFTAVRPQGLTLDEIKLRDEAKEAEAKRREEAFEPEGRPPPANEVEAVRQQAGIAQPIFEAGPSIERTTQGMFPKLIPDTAEFGGTVETIGKTRNPISVPRIATMKLSDLMSQLSEPPEILMKFFGNRLKELVGDRPVHIVSEADMAKLTEEKRRENAPPGYYDPGKDHIVLAKDMVDGSSPGWLSNRIIVHEAMHAMTSMALTKYPVLSAATKLLMKEANTFLTARDAKARKAFDYAFENEREFLSEVISRPALQKWLAMAPASRETVVIANKIAKAMGLTGKIRSAWDAMRIIMKDIFNRMLGRVPEDSVLDQVFKMSEILEKANAELERMATAQGVSKAKLVYPSYVEKGEIPTDGLEPEPPARPLFGKMAIGMNKRWQEKYFKIIEKRNAEDMERDFRVAEREERQRQTEQWKQDYTKIYGEVQTDVQGRPDIAIGTFFNEGRLHGVKVGITPKLDATKLSPEQKSLLPKTTYGRGGINPDDLAGAFGLRSGDEVVQVLAQIQQAKGEAPFREYVKRITQQETSRRMRARFGDLEENIMNEAIEHVLGNTQMDLLHEELVGLGMQTGRELTFTKEDTVAFAKTKFDGTPVGQVTVEKMLRDAGKAGTDAELAHLDNKPEEAFKAKQKQYLAMRMAVEAKKLEREQRSFEETLKRYSNAAVAGIESEYLDFIHEIMIGIGRGVRRSIQNIERSKELKGNTDLLSFIQSKENATYGLREIPIADYILSGDYKPLEQMTVAEYRGAMQSINTLIHNGRDEAKINGEGVSGDRAKVITEMKDKLRTFPLKDYPATKGLGAKVSNIPKTYLAAGTSMETMLNRWDRNDPYGVFNKYLVYRLAEAANGKARLVREYSKLYQEAFGEPKDMNKLMDSPFNDPLKKSPENPNGAPWTGFARRNGLVILQNMGNEGNWNVLVKGFSRALGTDIDPEALRQWVFNNFTKEDFDRAQRVGDMFDKAFGLSEQVYNNTTGIVPERIPLKSIDTPYGTYPGWYHPLIGDPLREGFSERQRGGSVYDNNDYGHVALANGYTKRRTGATYPLSLEWDMVPIRLMQILHDVSFKEAILEAQKVFSDRGFREAVTAHYGEHYTDGLIPYLKGIAGAESIDSRAAALAARVSNFLRANAISTYIGFNPYTALKHGPTALVLSAKEVGPINFLKAGASLYSRSSEIALSNKEFVDKWSEEVGRRMQHWDETLVGQHKDIFGPGTTREKFMQAGSWLVAQSDMASVRPTWLAAYEKAMHDTYEQEGESNHGLSIAIANRAVRRAHGSTAITNLPALVARGGVLHSWLTTLYGFFGTMMQRRIEIAHQLNDTYQLGKAGEIKEAASNLPGIAASVFTYVIWPTIVEEYVTGLTTDDRRGWGAHVVSATFLGLASSMLYVRDMVHSFVTGHEPGVGLISSPLHDIASMFSDFKKGVKAFNKQNAGKTVGDTITAFGHATGMGPRTLASATRFGIDVIRGQQRPRTLQDYRMGLTRGTIKQRIQR